MINQCRIAPPRNLLSEPSQTITRVIDYHTTITPSLSHYHTKLYVTKICTKLSISQDGMKLYESDAGHRFPSTLGNRFRRRNFDV